MSNNGFRILFFLVFSLFVSANANAASSAGADELVSAAATNPLLMKIYNKDPRQAKAILADIRSLMKNPDAHGQTSTSGDLPLETRGAASLDAKRRLQKDRKLIKQNPLLDELYNKSPLATLRMLERMKEAAGAN